MSILRKDDLSYIIENYCFCKDLQEIPAGFCVTRNLNRYNLTFFQEGCAYLSDSAEVAKAKRFYQARKLFLQKLEAAVAEITKANGGKPTLYKMMPPALSDCCVDPKFFATFEFAELISTPFSFNSKGMCLSGVKTTLSNDEKLFINLLSAINALHSKGIAYGGVTTTGISVYENYQVGLFDFSHSCEVGFLRNLDLPYKLPEGNSVTPESDIYLFGAYILAVRLGTPLEKGLSDAEIFKQNETVLPSYLKAAVRWCLEENPMYRPSAEELLLLLSSRDVSKVPSIYLTDPKQCPWTADEQLNLPEGVICSRGANKGEYEFLCMFTADLGSVSQKKAELASRLEKLSISRKKPLADCKKSMALSAKCSYANLKPLANDDKDFYVQKLHLYAKPSDIQKALAKGGSRVFSAHNGTFTYSVRIFDVVICDHSGVDEKYENSQKVLNALCDYRKTLIKQAPESALAPIVVGKLVFPDVSATFYAEVTPVYANKNKTFDLKILFYDLAQSLAEYHKKGLLLGSFTDDCFAYAPVGDIVKSCFKFIPSVFAENHFPNNNLCLCALTQDYTEYLSPETASFDPDCDLYSVTVGSNFTKQSDIFSFGVLMCKLLCNALPTIKGENGLPSEIALKYTNLQWTFSVKNITDKSSVKKISNLLQWMLSEKDQRPTAMQVVEVLEGKLAPPTKCGTTNVFRPADSSKEIEAAEKNNSAAGKNCQPWESDKIIFIPKDGLCVYRATKESRYTVEVGDRFFLSVSVKWLVDKNYAKRMPKPCIVNDEVKDDVNTETPSAPKEGTDKTKAQACDNVWEEDNIVLIPKEGVTVTKGNRRSYYNVIDPVKHPIEITIRVHYLISDGYARRADKENPTENIVNRTDENTHVDDIPYTDEDNVAEDVSTDTEKYTLIEDSSTETDEYTLIEDESNNTGEVQSETDTDAPYPPIEQIDDFNSFTCGSLGAEVQSDESQDYTPAEINASAEEYSLEESTQAETDTPNNEGVPLSDIEVEDQDISSPEIEDSRLWHCDNDIVLQLPDGVFIEQAKKEPMYKLIQNGISKTVSKNQLLSLGYAHKK